MVRRAPRPKTLEVLPTRPKGRSFYAGTSIEAKFLALVEQKGWAAHRRGWPDFLVVVDDKPMMIEVKSCTDKLSKKQRELFTILETLGINVRVWWENEPDKLMPWRKFLERSGFLLRRDVESKASSPTNRNPPRYSERAVRRMIRRDRMVARELGRRD